MLGEEEEEEEKRKEMRKGLLRCKQPVNRGGKDHSTLNREKKRRMLRTHIVP